MQVGKKGGGNESGAAGGHCISGGVVNYESDQLSALEGRAVAGIWPVFFAKIRRLLSNTGSEGE
jgi:hypothetical protein